MKPRVHFSVRAALVLVALCVIPVLIVRLVMDARTEARRLSCVNNLRQIGEALHNYYQSYDCFPPAYAADASGKPMHSWRILIIPFMDTSSLYYNYNLSQPWDSPSNLAASNRWPNYIYVCPNHRDPPSPFTSYVALVGPGTAFPGSQSSKLGDSREGPARSIMVVEITDTDIGWTEPRDLDISKIDWRINGPKPPGVSSLDGPGTHVLFMDGHVSFITEGVSPPNLKAMATLDGGEPAPERK
jgi:prepilin-type processing-associated H-X9-DG protein